MRKSVLGIGVLCLSLFLATAGTILAQGAADPAATPPDQAAQPAAKAAAAKKTPQAVIDWYRKQIQRMEQVQRAAEIRRNTIRNAGTHPEHPAK